jgi:hypothetical protein
MGELYKAYHLMMNDLDNSGLIVPSKMVDYLCVIPMSTLVGYSHFNNSKKGSISNPFDLVNFIKAKRLIDTGIYMGKKIEIANNPGFYKTSQEGVCVNDKIKGLDSHGMPNGIELLSIDSEIINEISRIPDGFKVELQKEYDYSLNGLVDILSGINMTSKTRFRKFWKTL